MSQDSKSADIEVHQNVLETILAEAAQAYPHECCGLLLGHGTRIEQAVPARNVASDPRHRFELDPQALIDAHRNARGGEPQVLGHYHSHPGGAPLPSERDSAAATAIGQIWAIAGSGEIGWWRAGSEGLESIYHVIFYK